MARQAQHVGARHGTAPRAALGGRQPASSAGPGSAGRGAGPHLVRHILQQPHELLGQPQAAVRRRHGDGRHVAVPLLPGALDLAKNCRPGVRVGVGGQGPELGPRKQVAGDWQHSTVQAQSRAS